MNRSHIWALSLLAAASLAACGGGSSSNDTPRVAVAHTSGTIDATPFPSDQFTQADAGQATGLRVALPMPDCAVRVSDCQDISELNTLDGFSVWPRFTVPFTGDIDPNTVNSDSIYLQEVGVAGGAMQLGKRVGINQVSWDAPSKTLSFKSDMLLPDSTRHVLVITDRVKDANGQALDASGWLGSDGTPVNTALGTAAYRQALGQALKLLPSDGAKPVAASLFTTQTATRELAGMVAATQQRTAAGLDFAIAQTDGTATRAVFDVTQIESATFRRHVGTAPSFSESAMPLAALNVVAGSVGQVAYARFDSPRYLNGDVRMPPRGTLNLPEQLGEQRVNVQLFVPTGPKPAGGWPVVVFGHGFGGSTMDSPWTVASVLASHGLATASIHVVGHGGGEQGQVLIRTKDGQTHTVQAPGRGFDQNGDGQIASTEGSTAAAPYGVLGARDALRQTVVDLSELIRRLGSGVDVDGDGTPDFNGNHITYSGQSFGGVYGTMLLGVNKSIVAGVPNVGGGSLIEATRFGGLSNLRVTSLAGRTPSLINSTTATGAPSFIDNIPLRNQPVNTRHVPGALAIAHAFANSEWAQQAGTATAYAPLVMQRPLAGQIATPIIYQLAKGDTVMMNTSSSEVVRAGGFANRVSWYRHDLAVAQNPAVGNNPHGFITGVSNANTLPIALAGQHQIGRFLASKGTVFEDADGAGTLFENGIDETELDVLNFQP